MPNIKSAKKRLRQNIKARERNRTAKAALRTCIKKAESAIEGDDREKALASLKTASKKLDSTAQKKVIHSNLASRKKSRLTKKFNQKFASSTK